MTRRWLWMGTLGGLLISPVIIGMATLFRYLWPGFPLLGILDFFARIVAVPLSALTGQAVVWDLQDKVTQGLGTLLLAYALVLVAWCTVGGLVVGAVLEQMKSPQEEPRPS